MKPMNQYSNNFANIKRPEFLNTNNNNTRLTPPSSSFMSNIQSPEDKHSEGVHSLSTGTPVTPLTPNF